MVGAVLVRGSEIVAEGFHAGFGEAHAERALLEAFAGAVLPEDTLCVNLEPCCHHGKTPPCTDALISRGVKRVVVGMRDPDPRVAGKGIALLRAAGIDVRGPVFPVPCARFNRGFVSVRGRGRPWITLKSASTRGGRVANPDGSFLKITSAAQDAWSHTWLRATHDAILVGVGTVVADDPHLDTRFDERKRGLQPWRIVLDPRLRIPLAARVVSGTAAGRMMIVCAEGHQSSAISHQLRTRGVRVVGIPMAAGRFSLPALWKALVEPGGDYAGITSILVEGGPRTWQVFREEGCVDEEVTLIGQA